MSDTPDRAHDPTTGVILAAGAGSRLGELGRRYSKAMLPVAGQPLIAWVIARLHGAGIDHLVVVGHASDTALADFLQREHRGARLVQQDERRGIADALRLALPSTRRDRPYLACACDSVFEASDVAGFLERGRTSPGAAVIGVLEMGREATSTRSAVRVSGERVVEIVEKPAPGTMDTPLVSMPLYWLPPSFAPHLETPAPTRGESYVTTALATFIAAGGTLLAFSVRSRLEITTTADIARVEAALSD